MMELICIELGIESLRAEQRKESDVELSERRALRRSSSSSEKLGKDACTMTKEDEDGQEELYATLPPRSPVISVMGHVDHGKTTLMDALRRRAVTAIARGANTPSKGGGATTGNKAEKKKKMKNNGESSQQQQRKGCVGIVNGDVAGTEAGGITQVITAFEVPLPLLDEGITLADDDDGQSSSHHMISTVTFLDTPGHAAFKKMCHSGSLATDVIVLVVAADDGVSPQTIEIIDMYKSIARAQPQSISLVIAVSKIDKPGIDVDEAVMRIENQLIEHDLFTENVVAGGGDEGEFGSCQLFPVSGITGEGLDDLVEGLALQAEIMDLRADEDAMGEGIVIDARMERGLGVVADCIIRWGSVSRGDFVVSGTHGGRVKFLYNVGNKTITKA
jgi:translation initiation factor IF-2